MSAVTEMPNYEVVRRLAEAQGLRLLRHPSNRKTGAWKVRDGDGNTLCWPSPPDVVEHWLQARYDGPARNGLTIEEYVEQLELLLGELAFGGTQDQVDRDADALRRNDAASKPGHEAFSHRASAARLALLTASLVLSGRS